MVGDEVIEAGQGESEPTQRRGRALGLIAVAATVAVAASVAYLKPHGTPLIGAPAAQLGTPTPADYQLRGGPPLSDPTAGSIATPGTGGFLWRGAVRVVIERIGGLNDQPPSSLIASVGISDPAVATSLLTQLNDLPPFAAGLHCPMDDGSYFVLIFTYVDGTKVTVRVEATGCEMVFAGDSTQPVAWAEPSANFLVSLEGLVTPQPSG